MLASSLCRAIWHACRFGWRRTVIAAIAVIATLGLYFLHAVAWGNLYTAVAFGVAVVALSFILPFLYYLTRRDDPSRRITPRQRRTIVKYLIPYGQDGMRGQSCRIIRLHYYPRVRDAVTFGREIREILQDAGWAADIEDTDAISEPETHAQGLWAYGQSTGDPSPETAKLLQEAFGQVGLAVHIDTEHYGEQGTCLVVGFWECPWGFRYATFLSRFAGIKRTISATVHRVVAIPASIAGVTRRV